MKIRGPVLIAVLFAAPALHCDDAFSADTGNTIEALPFVMGTWEGEGWIRQGSSAPQKFRSQELVARKAGGKIVVITGKHTSTETGQVVHDAFAIVSPGLNANAYRFQSFLANGQVGDDEGHLENGAFIWEKATPSGGKLRFTIQIANDQWQETGQFSSDGKQWHDFFSMTLKRVTSNAKACD
jgi:hypothetical protein